MCKAKKPDYEEPPEYARAKEPDNASLYEEAQRRAASRGGGARRMTVLSGLRGNMQPPVLGAQTGQRSATTLG